MSERDTDLRQLFIIMIIIMIIILFQVDFILFLLHLLF